MNGNSNINYPNIYPDQYRMANIQQPPHPFSNIGDMNQNMNINANINSNNNLNKMSSSQAQSTTLYPPPPHQFYNVQDYYAFAIAQFNQHHQNVQKNNNELIVLDS